MVTEFTVKIAGNDVVVRPDFTAWKLIELTTGKSMLDLARSVSSLTLAEKSTIFTKISHLDAEIVDKFLVEDFIPAMEVLSEILNKLIGLDDK